MLIFKETIKNIFSSDAVYVWSKGVYVVEYINNNDFQISQDTKKRIIDDLIENDILGYSEKSEIEVRYIDLIFEPTPRIEMFLYIDGDAQHCNFFI